MAERAQKSLAKAKGPAKPKKGKKAGDNDEREDTLQAVVLLVHWIIWKCMRLKTTYRSLRIHSRRDITLSQSRGQGYVIPDFCGLESAYDSDIRSINFDSSGNVETCQGNVC